MGGLCLARSSVSLLEILASSYRVEESISKKPFSNWFANLYINELSPRCSRLMVSKKNGKDQMKWFDITHSAIISY